MKINFEELFEEKILKRGYSYYLEDSVHDVTKNGNCYEGLVYGNEDKARNLILEFIKNNPDEDEAYMCMQNWYMYDKPDINKLAKVIDLAETNNHILFTDFGYDRLVQFYDSIGDTKNKQKYEELYSKWKSKRETIEF